MFKKFKKIRFWVLLSHLITTLAYPAVKVYASESNRLLIFTDTITIIAAVLIIGGIIYAAVLHGDFDITAFVLRRGMQKEATQSFQEYKAEINEKREDAFNYPLFLGLVYLAIAAVIAYAFL